ncbi:MAG: hypothetical protein ACTSVZ_09720 [Promethearchaeota archaeon]
MFELSHIPDGILEIKEGLGAETSRLPGFGRNYGGSYAPYDFLSQAYPVLKYISNRL